MDDPTRPAFPRHPSPEDNPDDPALTPEGAQASGETHIVDILIEERARHLLNMPIVWPLIKSVFYPLLGYEAAKRAVNDTAPMATSREAFAYLSELLAIDLRIEGTEHIPTSGKVILVANHPTGIADGIALYHALRPIRDDINIFANRDAVRACPPLGETIIPVEWVEDKRTRAKTKETLLLARKAFEKDRLVVIFPSGRLAHMTMTGLRERPWLTTTLSLMRRHQAPILPVHITARNSLLYYTLHFLSNELRDMTLFHELLNKRGEPYRMTFGPLIEPAALDGDPETQIKRLQHHVARRMGPGKAPQFS